MADDTLDDATEKASDPWRKLRGFTQARIGQARSGHAPTTAELLKFQRAHAAARDAVWTSWDVAAFAKLLNEECLVVESAASSRAEFLKRPDLGRKLSRPFRSEAAELSIIISDGLSARAVTTHFPPLWKTLKASFAKFNYGPLILAPYGRVALADEIGQSRRSEVSIIFLGERPGLSAIDSLGIYLTYKPRRGRTDAERNCISNVREPRGLPYDVAADRLIYLVDEALRLKLSGTELKENATIKTLR